MRAKPHYEIQVRHRNYGWTKAGNWPSRTLAEGIASLKQCADGLYGDGSTWDYRLVRLSPVVLSVKKARRKKERE